MGLSVFVWYDRKAYHMQVEIFLPIGLQKISGNTTLTNVLVQVGFYSLIF